MQQFTLNQDSKGNFISKQDSATIARTEQKHLFYETQIEELVNWLPKIQGTVEFTDDHDLKTMLSQWWYCNHIKGWNNDVPSEKPMNGPEYTDIPKNKMMSDTIRNCWISIQREKVYFKKEYALERCLKAITSYKDRLGD